MNTIANIRKTAIMNETSNNTVINFTNINELLKVCDEFQNSGFELYMNDEKRGKVIILSKCRNENYKFDLVRKTLTVSIYK